MALIYRLPILYFSLPSTLYLSLSLTLSLSLSLLSLSLFISQFLWPIPGFLIECYVQFSWYHENKDHSSMKAFLVLNGCIFLLLCNATKADVHLISCLRLCCFWLYALFAPCSRVGYLHSKKESELHHRICGCETWVTKPFLHQQY